MYLLNLVEVFNIDLFLGDSNQSIINKFQGNNFRNWNMRFLIEDLTSSEITTLPDFCLEKFNLSDLSNFLVNSLSKLILERND
jgi:hypothetical protein